MCLSHGTAQGKAAEGTSQAVQLHRRTPRVACAQLLLAATAHSTLHFPVCAPARDCHQHHLIPFHFALHSKGHLGLIRGYTNCILTPNIAEFGRLAEGAGVTLEGRIGTQWQQHVSVLEWVGLVWHRRQWCLKGALARNGRNM